MTHLLIIAYFFAFGFATGENCQTPTGQNGECIPLSECQPLLWSFANPKDGMVEYLEKFECRDNRENGIYVCCRVATDTLVFEDEEDSYDPDSIYNIKTLTNVASCGMQGDLMSDNKLLHLKDFPWMVRIISTDEVYSFERLGCTGVLINQRYILYTAQCHYAKVDPYPYYFIKIDYYTGDENNCDEPSISYTRSCSNYNTYGVELLTIHPFYDHVTKINDLALIRISRRIEFSNIMYPVCLPLVDETFIPHKVMYTLGWNHTDHLTDISVKTANTSNSITNCACEDLNKGRDILTAFDMCTINRTNTDDNSIGYPVMSLYQHQWYILGFTSRGKEPRIHTRIQNYLQWIKEAIGGERCLTPSNEIGECVQINDCPKLMVVFANVNPKDEDYLNKFLCDYDPIITNENDSPAYPLTACCSYNANFTISTTPSGIESNFYNISDTQYCGLQHHHENRFDDEKVSVYEFPWLAAILNATLPLAHEVICGGSLITNRYVLTSTQCVKYFRSEDVMLVRLGDYKLESDVGCIQAPRLGSGNCNNVQKYKVAERKVHPFYNGFQFLNDIALLKLENIVTYSEYVRPICLPISENDPIEFNGTVYMSGFGDIKKGEKGSGKKKKIFTSLMSLDLCKEKGKQYYFANPPTEYQICTELFKNSTDVACDGDEGGPIMIKKRFRWYIIGISSTYGCTNGEPLVHSNVFKYLEWIKLNIKD